jgi:hypothetical protein
MEELDIAHLEFNPLEDTEKLEIPEDPTAGWCDLVSEYYGRQGYKVVVSAESFMRQKPMAGSMSGHRRFTIEKPLNDSNQDTTHAFYGVFYGLELRPELEVEEMHRYIPFARLGNVVDLNADIEISAGDDSDILIPVRNTRSLLLMRY